MLVGTVAFNTLRIIDPSSPNALSIWVLGYVFQGLGMAIAFIVSPGSLSRCDSPLITIQFITVHFYRAIRYGFHRCVHHVYYIFATPLIEHVEVLLQILPSSPLARQVTPLCIVMMQG